MLLVGFGVAWSACASRRQADDKMQVAEQELAMLVVKFTQVDSYPGMQSNLQKTRTYHVFLRGNFSEELEVYGLHIDSLILRTYTFALNDEIKRMPFPTVRGDDQLLDLTFSRQYFQDYDAQDTMRYMEKADVVLDDGHFHLILRSPTKTHIVPLKEPVVLESLFAP